MIIIIVGFIMCAYLVKRSDQAEEIVIVNENISQWM